MKNSPFFMFKSSQKGRNFEMESNFWRTIVLLWPCCVTPKNTLMWGNVVSIVLTNEMVTTKTLCLCLVHKLNFFCILAVSCLAASPLSPSIDQINQIHPALTTQRKHVFSLFLVFPLHFSSTETNESGRRWNYWTGGGGGDGETKQTSPSVWILLSVKI